MSLEKRATLKNYFLKGSTPKSEHFQNLIDSTINQSDDGILKKDNEALRIKAEGKNQELLQFFNNIDDLKTTWKISQLNENGNEGLNFKEANGESRLFIEKGGNVGIGTTNPESKLHVDGFVGMIGRIGHFAKDEVPADGEWHNIITNLNNYCAFEIVAVSGRKGAHSITHAIAVSSYGNSKAKIKKTQAYYGRVRNKIDFKWTGTYFNYQLKIRTKRNLGKGVYISYHVTKLF